MDVGGEGFGGLAELSHSSRQQGYPWSTCEGSGDVFHCYSQQISPKYYNVVSSNYSRVRIFVFQIITTFQVCELEQTLHLSESQNIRL